MSSSVSPRCPCWRSLWASGLKQPRRWGFMSPSPCYGNLPVPPAISSLSHLLTLATMARHYYRIPERWRRGILLGCISAFTILALNLVATVAATANSSRGSNGNIFQGNCNKAAHVNLGLHSLVNVMSTLLLAASNYGMQCLSAPTRSEVDKAHRRRARLDIGVMGFRNTRWVHWGRGWAWFLLGISSMPLHLL